MSKHRRSEGNIRRSQVLTTAGPGAIVDLVDYAVVIKGLDSWQYGVEGEETFIGEPRLEAEALRMLRGTGNWKWPHVRLRSPPATPDDHDRIGPWQGMHAREFPLWYQCRTCRALVRRDALDDKRRHTCFLSGETRGHAVPVRFVGGCSKGHLADINWRYFVHFGELEEGVKEPFRCTVDDKKSRLRNKSGEVFSGDLALVSTGTSGDLSDLMVLCRRCGRSRSLQDLRRPHAIGSCYGWRPWLSTNEESCDQALRLLIRTGSNVWFPQRLSALHIPEDSSGLRSLVSLHWDKLKKVTSVARLQLLLEMVEELEEIFRPHIDPENPSDGLEAVFAAIQAKANAVGDGAEPIRATEWNTLVNSKYGPRLDIPPSDKPWYARSIDFDEKAAPFIQQIVLVHTLREVRAIVGFTRIEGVSANAEGDLQLEGQRTAPLSEHQDWIPAVEINGEGVFIAFREADLQEWESRGAVKDRAKQFVAGLQLDNEGRKSESPVPFTSARLLMLHSLAHMLISQISLECGYSASAIRERIYCFKDDENPERNRAGILLYTGTPGSEGTLGGLVEVGADIVRHLRLAAERNLICSNDPVCAQHRPDGPEAGRRQEGAACHGCLLIAEPSCERMNRDLDRALVVPTLEMADAAFLRDWV